MMQTRAPYTYEATVDGEHARILCEFLYAPENEWLPISLSRPDYTEEYDRIVSEETIAAYVPPSSAELLAVERASMNPPKAAFMEAAVRVPSFEATHDNLLETFDTAKAAQGARGTLDRWDRSVTIVVRLHPDMTGFAQAFRMSGEKLDALCRFAIAYNADPAADFTDEIAAFNAIDYEAAP